MQSLFASYRFILHTVLFAVVFSFLISCVGQKTKNALPDWYLNPASNDQNNLYGVGDGFTIQEASRSALNNLASKLMVTLSSESSTVMQETNAGISEEMHRKIDELVEKITFNNYKVSKSASVDNRIYAEVKVDRANFIQDRSERLAELNHQMDDIYKNSTNKNILEKRNGLAKINKIAREAQAINYILSGLGVAINKAANLEKYGFYQKQYNQVLDKIEFFVDLNGSPLQMAQVITSALNQEKIKVVKSKNISGDNLVIIDIKTDIVHKSIYGSNIAKLKISFKLLSSTNKILSSNVIEVSGSSVVSENEAMNAAIANLDEQIKKDGILKILGVME